MPTHPKPKLRRAALASRGHSLERIKALAEEGRKGKRDRVGMIRGLNGRWLVQDGKRNIWSYSPVKGLLGQFTKQRVYRYAEQSSVISAIRSLPEELKREITTGAGEKAERLNKKFAARLKRKTARFPEFNEAEFSLDLSREEFGKIYFGLMNELNVRMATWTRAHPFETGTQWVRREQAKLLLKGDKSAEFVHNNFPDETGKEPLLHHGASMTNELSASIFIREEHGKPTIEIRNPRTLGNPMLVGTARQHVGFMSTVLESMLKELGVKYKKKTE